MTRENQKLLNISDELISLEEFELAKRCLDKINQIDDEINDEKIFKSSIIELKMNGLKSAQKLIIQNKKNFKKELNYKKSLAKLNFTYFCPVSRIHVDKFSPLPSFYEQNLRENEADFSVYDFETLNVNDYQCIASGSNDRDRLFALFINELLSETAIGKVLKVLDFAPSPVFERFMRWHNNIDYTTADGLLTNYDLKIDVQNMNQIESNTYDGIICSHVLEHVPNDIRAIEEIFRVLKNGGWAILMVPICLAKDNIDEDFQIDDISERWRRFGQDDHLRLYSKTGFIERIKSSGFQLLELGKDYFGIYDLHRCGIDEKSILYLGIKNTQ